MGQTPMKKMRDIKHALQQNCYYVFIEAAPWKRRIIDVRKRTDKLQVKLMSGTWVDVKNDDIIYLG